MTKTKAFKLFGFHKLFEVKNNKVVFGMKYFEAMQCLLRRSVQKMVREPERKEALAQKTSAFIKNGK